VTLLPERKAGEGCKMSSASSDTRASTDSATAARDGSSSSKRTLAASPSSVLLRAVSVCEGLGYGMGLLYT
jgi:hypothetical protein